MIKQRLSPLPKNDFYQMLCGVNFEFDSADANQFRKLYDKILATRKILYQSDFSELTNE
jgi:hypothetical protein